MNTKKNLLIVCALAMSFSFVATDAFAENFFRRTIKKAVKWHNDSNSRRKHLTQIANKCSRQDIKHARGECAEVQIALQKECGARQINEGHRLYGSNCELVHYKGKGLVSKFSEAFNSKKSKRSRGSKHRRSSTYKDSSEQLSPKKWEQRNQDR